MDLRFGMAKSIAVELLFCNNSDIFQCMTGVYNEDFRNTETVPAIAHAPIIRVYHAEKGTR